MGGAKLRFFDLHAHAQPDRFIRRYTVESLNCEMQQNNSYAVFKSHTNSTVALVEKSKNVYGSVVLNEYQGGLSLPVIISQFLISDRPFLIWMPTLTNYAKPKTKQAYFNNMLDMNNFVTRISERGRLKKQVKQIISFAGENDLAIATGHSNKEEVYLLIEEAKRSNTRIIITHPFYHLTDFSVNELAKIAQSYCNCYFECNILMNLIGDETIQKDVSLIEAVGRERVFVSSDLGQKDRISIKEGYELYSRNLAKQINTTVEYYEELFFSNPQKILFGKRRRDT